MPYRVNIEYNLNPTLDCIYKISPLHRRTRGNTDKSIWTISNEEEVELFIFSKSANWTEDNVCYGLKLNGTAILVIGRTPDNHNLKIAKFVDGNRNNKWHGYPADPKNKSQDIPCTEILTSWRNLNYIGKSDVRKLKQQIPCDL
jgi:hypothetical protein